MPLCKPARKSSNAASRISKVRLAAMIEEATVDAYGDSERGRERQSVPILDLPLPSPRPEGVEWIEAYRHWIGG
ncbi:MAG: hypothetical protein ABI316_06550 [Casimicrobiaceae bacterium]